MASSVTQTFVVDNGSEHREASFEQLMSRSHTDMRISLDPAVPAAQFGARARRAQIGDLVLVDAQCSPCSGRRDSDEINRSDDEQIVFLITRSGRELVTQHDQAATLQPGTTILWDTTEPAAFRVLTPVRKRSLFVPRRALGEVGVPGISTSRIELHDDSSLALLTGYLDVLSRTVDGMAPAALSAAREATLSLVAAVLQNAPANHVQGIGAALRASMLTSIDRHLTVPELGPAMLARLHHVSVRSVHRVFADSGETVMGTIRSRRLAGARRALTDSGAAVSSIAQQWCFSDASHLARAFRDEYGLSPSEYRKIHA
ncbi:putative AraC family transcriptional regulator [Gordonia hirsuta DSM 44140 = NBRC 16056]|uniref:Putative AraC family transcriptional regulator n=1 Tax=Gordonia hirsuta DSM 44140 = NBRC 16056 TaxID=1121927 RepID=L7L9I9_9ACTN|nr:helix-turn-helix domain-containing protein [Gordonia hirsuta]GAC57810.1 putative AraC family transcriptional regulator [Gordonia hirsuta DSM 44140 = NBRC 16056]